MDGACIILHEHHFKTRLISFDITTLRKLNSVANAMTTESEASPLLLRALPSTVSREYGDGGFDNDNRGTSTVRSMGVSKLGISGSTLSSRGLWDVCVFSLAFFLAFTAWHPLQNLESTLFTGGHAQDSEGTFLPVNVRPNITFLLSHAGCRFTPKINHHSLNCSVHAHRTLTEMPTACIVGTDVSENSRMCD